MIPWRLVGFVCLLLVVLPPSLAYGWTRYRYGQGTYSQYSREYHHTGGFADRVYNAAYREHGCESGWWEVHYRKYPGHFSDITWLVESGCSPTEQGQTGPREPFCLKESDTFVSGAYNCDTTRP